MANANQTNVQIQLTYRGPVRPDAERLADALRDTRAGGSVTVNGDENELQLGAGTILVVLVASALGKAALKVAIDRLKGWASKRADELDSGESLRVTVRIEGTTSRNSSANLILKKGAIAGTLVLLQVADDALERM